jgi:anti-sigma B factor antagonist
VGGISYSRNIVNGVPVVSAPAELDISTADQLRAVLLDAAAQGHTTVVVDMTRTQFCDSYGLHTLLRAHSLARAEGGELRLVIPADGAVPRIFALTSLDRLMPSFASLKEALAQTPGAAALHDPL